VRRQEEKARGGQPFTEHSTDTSSCSVIILQSQQPTKILKVKILHNILLRILLNLQCVFLSQVNIYSRLSVHMTELRH